MENYKLYQLTEEEIKKYENRKLKVKDYKFLDDDDSFSVTFIESIEEDSDELDLLIDAIKGEIPETHLFQLILDDSQKVITVEFINYSDWTHKDYRNEVIKFLQGWY